MWEWLYAELFSVLGVLLGVILLIRILREQRSPSSTLAWLIGIILLPFLSIPLYILIGGRRVKRHRRKKKSLYQAPDDARQRGADLGTGQLQPHEETVQLLEIAGIPPPRQGNRIEFIANGQRAFHRLMAMLEAAEKSILIEAFILGRGEVGKAIVRMLARQARRGVEVKLLVDDLGAFFAKWAFVNPIRRAGGKVAVFSPMLPLRLTGIAHLRNHRKLAIIDHRRAMVGGMNLTREYMGPRPDPKRWADTAAIIEGPAVRDFFNIFAADWEYAKKEQVLPPVRATFPPAGDTLVQVVAGGPDAEVVTLFDAISNAMMLAKKRLWICSPYFVPDDALLRMLKILARMNRDVRIVVPRRSNHPIADLARGAFFRELADSQVKLYGYKPGMLHAKLMVIDDQLALVGSANLDVRSLYLNYELGALIYSADKVRLIADVIGDYIDKSEPYTAEEGIRKSFPVELVEDVCRLFAPIL